MEDLDGLGESHQGLLGLGGWWGHLMSLQERQHTSLESVCV